MNQKFCRRALSGCRRWSAYLHKTPGADELAAICRSGETGLPYGESAWVNRLGKRLKLDLVIRPRGRPKKVKGR
jgi:hypothetical protein